MRLIDADALKRRAITVRFFGKDIMMVPTAEIDDAPTIDAVEVVRCKDCRWWNGSQETIHNNHLCRNWSKFGSINTSADDYCSWGERREE